MEQVGRLSFVPLLGDPPPGLDLDPLPAPASVRSQVEDTFSEFFASAADVQTVDGVSRPIPPASGLHIIYAYGHAWLTPEGPCTSSVAGDKTVVENGGELVGRLLSAASGERTILILDTCYAAAFETSFVPPVVSPRLVVYSSGATEKAIALNGDRASRFSLALSRQLSGKSPSVDLVRVVLNIAEALDKDGIITGQQVTYRMNGSALRLVRGSPGPARMRERTVSRIRNLLFCGGRRRRGIAYCAGVVLLEPCAPGHRPCGASGSCIRGPCCRDRGITSGQRQSDIRGQIGRGRASAVLGQGI